ncbi:MAG: DNA polymerase III subunit delta' [candidate division NC10 bacterium]|jgi:DNA polymerase-3 subunit delta'
MGFSEIFGQRQAISLVGRVIETGRLPHALLFTGPKGVGRSLTAVTVAKALNCLAGIKGDCCDRCPACHKIAKGIHPDVHLLAPEGATLKIDQIRTLTQEAALRPYEGRRKVFILNEAETMTEQAQNALLKTLEEPPGATLLILIAPEASALLPPIASRCSQIRFTPLPESAIAARLQEQGCDEEEAHLLASLAAGSLGRAQELRQSALQEIWDLIDQAIALSPGKTLPVLELTERVVRRKETLSLFLEALLAWCRDLMVSKVTRHEARLVYRRHGAALKRQSERLTLAQLLAMYHTVKQTLDGLGRYANPRLSLEIMFLKLRDLQTA